MIVMKFGGSSVESAAAIERVASIVKARVERHPVVVVSAMGKTTNNLLAIASRSAAGKREEAIKLTVELRDFHLREARPAVLDSDWPLVEGAIQDHFQEIAELARALAVVGEITPRLTDAISSYGERISSIVVTYALRRAGMDAVHVDSRRVVVTDNRHTQAAPKFAESYSRMAAAVAPLTQRHVVVMGGFIAATESGVTTTLGRGGSDFTASIVGAGIGAEEIEIWTDVDGMLTGDPRVIDNVRRVKTISFGEAAELAYFGAKVLHPATVLPAVEKNIPVLILNSRRPEVEGTRIVAESVPCTNPIKSIACKRNITLVNVTSTRMLMAHGFLHRIFEVFDRFETAVDMVSTSEVSVSLTIDNTARLKEITTELEAFAEVNVEQNQAIVCLVGDSIRSTAGVAGRIFRTLGDVNISMISQGASLLNFGFVVSEADLARAVAALHDEFFAEVDPAVFD